MADDKKAKPDPRTLDFRYQKSRHFRAIHADGAFGGVAPSGFIHFALFNERVAIPKHIAIEIVDGVQQPEKIVDELGGYVREVEVDVIMDINAATSLYKWLGVRIELLRSAVGVSDEDWAKMMGEKDG